MKAVLPPAEATRTQNRTTRGCLATIAFLYATAVLNVVRLPLVCLLLLPPAHGRSCCCSGSCCWPAAQPPPPPACLPAACQSSGDGHVSRQRNGG